MPLHKRNKNSLENGRRVAESNFSKKNKREISGRFYAAADPSLSCVLGWQMTHDNTEEEREETHIDNSTSSFHLLQEKADGNDGMQG